ncbi:hypothetical protein HOY82DRAFT_344212 [Tuber indicum]|nr:hypothetical protein HOY82DRAFT_344212 [Tuber indicum]
MVLVIPPLATYSCCSCCYLHSCSVATSLLSLRILLLMVEGLVGPALASTRVMVHHHTHAAVLAPRSWSFWALFSLSRDVHRDNRKWRAPS